MIANQGFPVDQGCVVVIEGKFIVVAAPFTDINTNMLYIFSSGKAGNFLKIFLIGKLVTL